VGLLVVVTLLKGIPKLATKGWKNRRIRAMNRIGEQKIGGRNRGTGGMIEEYVETLESKAKNKKEFKLEQKKAKEKRDKEYKGFPKP
jgi:hypothetical protein